MTADRPAEHAAIAALAAVGVDLLAVLPASELTSRYPSVVGRLSRRASGQPRLLAAVLRCGRKGISSSRDDCGAAWAVTTRNGRPARIGKVRAHPEPRLRSAAWSCPEGRVIADGLWVPCNSEHLGTAAGDRATDELRRLLAPPREPARHPGSRSPYVRLIAAELQRAADEGLPRPLQVELAVKLKCSPSTVSHAMPQVRELMGEEGSSSD